MKGKRVNIKSLVFAGHNNLAMYVTGNSFYDVLENVLNLNHVNGLRTLNRIRAHISHTHKCHLVMLNFLSNSSSNVLIAFPIAVER